MANKSIPKVPFDGDKFKEILKERNLSIRKLCQTNALDRSSKTISRAIRDEEITINSLNSICETIGIDPNLLIKGENDMETLLICEINKCRKQITELQKAFNECKSALEEYTKSKKGEIKKQ